MSFEKWLPPLEVCCNKVNHITIVVMANATLHFKSKCPVHGQKGVGSPFSKMLLGYSVIVSKNITQPVAAKFSERKPFDATRSTKTSD